MNFLNDIRSFGSDIFGSIPFVHLRMPAMIVHTLVFTTKFIMRFCLLFNYFLFLLVMDVSINKLDN